MKPPSNKSEPRHPEDVGVNFQKRCEIQTRRSKPGLWKVESFVFYLSELPPSVGSRSLLGRSVPESSNLDSKELFRVSCLSIFAACIEPSRSGLAA